MSLVPHLHTLFSAYWLVHPLKKSLSFLHKCLIYLWSTLKGYWKTKLNFHCSPLENSMVLLNRAQISPIHFCWNTWKAFSLCSSWTITNVYIHLPKKSFSFDLGRNGYQMNISLTCSLLKGRKRFLLSDLILIFLSFSYLVTHSTCLQSWVEKWEFITLFFFHAIIDLFAKKVFPGFWDGQEMPQVHSFYLLLASALSSLPEF